MHYVYLVSIFADNEHEAINWTEELLDSQNFVENGGYWGGGKCDWYVIGGRWDTYFKWLLYRDERIKTKDKESKAYKTEIALLESTFKEIPEKEQELKAFIPTKKQWKSIQEAFKGEGVEIAITNDGYVDKEVIIDNVKYKDIKNKYLVVIDYHI